MFSWNKLLVWGLEMSDLTITSVPNLGFDKEMTLKSEKHFKHFEVNAG